MRAKNLSKVLTKENLEGLYFKEGLSFKAIAQRYGCMNSNIAYYFRKYQLKGRATNMSFSGGVPWNKGKSISDGTIDEPLYVQGVKSAKRRYGKDHPNYKGGWQELGYHCRSDHGRTIREHRYILEQHLRRPLRDDEVVHHKNGDKLDNRLENLEILTAVEHAYRHVKDRAIAQYGVFTTDTVCRVGGCPNKYKSKGFCTTHYKQLMRGIDPLCTKSVIS